VQEPGLTPYGGARGTGLISAALRCGNVRGEAPCARGARLPRSRGTQ
jgi:hypothetical protein